jgi:putative transposase
MFHMSQREWAKGEERNWWGEGCFDLRGGWKGLQGVRESGEVVRGDERILGGSEFVERVLKESQEGWEKKYLFRKKGYSLEWLLGRVAAHFGVTAKAIKSTSKVPRVAKARAVVCHVGARKLGVTSAAIAKELGISPSAVSKAIARTSEALDLDHIEKKVLECQ